jgi:hypothetical protein
VAAIAIAAGCRKTESIDRRGDTNVIPPVSVGTVDSTAHIRNCGISGMPVLTDEGLGELQPGRTVKDVSALCDVLSDTVERREGMNERVVTVRIAGDFVEATVNDDRIQRVEISSPRYRTRDSLGVDTPLSRIARSKGARFLPGEDGVYGFTADHCGLSFRFSVPLRPPTGRDWTVASITALHSDATVDRVLVTTCQR